METLSPPKELTSDPDEYYSSVLPEQIISEVTGSLRDIKAQLQVNQTEIRQMRAGLLATPSANRTRRRNSADSAFIVDDSLPAELNRMPRASLRKDVPLARGGISLDLGCGDFSFPDELERNARTPWMPTNKFRALDKDHGKGGFAKANPPSLPVNTNLFSRQAPQLRDDPSAVSAIQGAFDMLSTSMRGLGSKIDRIDKGIESQIRDLNASTSRLSSLATSMSAFTTCYVPYFSTLESAVANSQKMLQDAICNEFSQVHQQSARFEKALSDQHVMALESAAGLARAMQPLENKVGRSVSLSADIYRVLTNSKVISKELRIMALKEALNELEPRLKKFLLEARVMPLPPQYPEPYPSYGVDPPPEMERYGSYSSGTYSSGASDIAGLLEPRAYGPTVGSGAPYNSNRNRNRAARRFQQQQAAPSRQLSPRESYGQAHYPPLHHQPAVPIQQGLQGYGHPAPVNNNDPQGYGDENMYQGNMGPAPGPNQNQNQNQNMNHNQQNGYQFVADGNGGVHINVPGVD